MNTPIFEQEHIRTSFAFKITPEDVLETLPTPRGRERMLEMTEEVLAQVMNLWRPKAVYKWLNLEDADSSSVVLSSGPQGRTTTLQLGFSTQFVAPAKQVLIGVYTAGQELDHASREASMDKRLMDAYLIDLVALRVLKEVELFLTGVVEEAARKSAWGVSPYLSPGSVHGWDLADQPNLCSLLNLDAIDVNIDRNGTFTPFKTVSCLIGIGPDFESTQVGPTCLVCSNRENCDHCQL